VRRAWGAFVRACAAREGGVASAIWRVAVGVAVARTLLAVAWAGAVPLVWWDAADGGYRDLGHGPWLVAALGGPTPGVVGALWMTGVVGGVLVALGLGGPVLARALSFATLTAFQAVTDLNSHAGGSYDELLLNQLWLLTLLGPTGTGSLECRLEHGSWTSHAQVARWPRLLGVFQAVLMYTTTGLQKLSVHWVPGGDLSALYYILQQPTWQHADHAWVAWLYPLTQLGTLASWTWEVSAPLWGLAVLAEEPGAPLGRLGAWLRRWRARDVYLAVGLAFHLGIAALLDIGSFTWASLALYATFFSPGTWARALALDPAPRAAASR
jgi:hypothetical protein